MCGILQIVRIETADWHARVEKLVPIFSDSFSLDNYTTLLEQFYGFYAGFERELARRSATLDELLPDWRERLKLPLLQEDLLWLGRTEAELKALPVCSQLPAIYYNSELFGALYVSEGSTLGGQVITKHLQASFGLQRGRGVSFFAGHADRTGAMWQAFTNTFCRVAATPDTHVIVHAAQSTFQALWIWLSQTPSHGEDGTRDRRFEVNHA